MGGDRHARHKFAGAAVLFAIVDEEIFQAGSTAGHRRCRRCRVAPSAISAGGPSPMGEPLAILPPMVAALRTCSEE